MAKKQVLQGIDNFRELIDKDGYYVDKTFLIKDLIDKPDKIVLITRPRRFGKTLNMSMLKYFFEIPECRKHELEDVDTGYLFEDLKIFNSSGIYKEEQGRYPVVYLTLKNAKQDNWEGTIYNLRETIANEYKRHRYILETKILSDVEKNRYRNIMDSKAKDIEYTDLIPKLSEYLKRYFKKNCLVIIDEYDTPIQAGYINGYFEIVIEFMKSLLVKGFKDNNALKQGVLTGIMKVAQESIFSDFNNPLVSTVLSEEFADSFGFTEKEVEKMADYLGLSNTLEDIKKWYNGYIFGNDTVIYNPWSIIKYLYNPKNGLKPYWINTSDNSVIKEVMHLDKVEGKQVVEKLIKGEEVKKVIEENVVYQSIKDNPDSAWSFLLHAGYLKAYGREKRGFEEKFTYKIAIPNVEVKTIYKDIIVNFFKDDMKISVNIEAIMKALLKKDMVKFSRLLEELYLKQVSYNDPGIKSMETLPETEQDTKYENFHHGFMLGLFMLIGPEYRVDSNKEYGLGRPDIVIIPEDKTKTAYIFEFKWESTKGSKTLETLVGEAEKQIKDQKYKEGLKAVYDIDSIICIGAGFKGKKVKLRVVSQYS